MIPDFQTLMLPILVSSQDGADHVLATTREELAEDFHLSDAEKDQLLPSGRQTTFANRTAWATSYLRAGGLLESTGRGRFRITERGSAVLKQAPQKIDIPFLMQFAEFRAFRERSEKQVGSSAAPVTQPADQTPEEAFEAAFQSIQASIEQDLLNRVKAASPAFFEQLVVDVLVAMGYGGSHEDAGKAIGKSGDGGIDGVIKEDRLGLDTIYVQAKRWDSSVGRPVVQAFVGSLAGRHSRRGVIITTSDFTSEARSYVRDIEQQVILVNGAELARLMFEFGVGVTPVGTPYVLKRVDLDFFGDV